MGVGKKTKKHNAKKKIGSDKKPISEHILEGFIISGSIIVSLVTAIFSIKGKFDAFQTLSTTMLSFLCTEYVSHSILEKSKYFKAKQEYYMFEQANEWSGKLYEMNEYCETIIERGHGPHDLFLLTCKKNIDNLYYVLQTAARDEKIEIESDYIINSGSVYEALNVTKDKIVELTFPINNLNDGVLQTPEDQKFFETSIKMLQERYVQTIRVLLILGDESFINDPKLTSLFEFYNTNNGFEGKYISKTDFVKACESNMISSAHLDFGIYGPEMLFKVESYSPYKGVYTKDKDEVARYRKHFDEIWSFAAMTHDLPDAIDNKASTQSKPMSAENLLKSLAGKPVNSHETQMVSPPVPEKIVSEEESKDNGE